MASLLARRALTTSSRRTFSTSARRLSDKGLKEEGKQNPELWILGGVMVAALGGAGWYFGSTPGTSTEAAPVSKAGMPWETNAEGGKYKYHPHGDPNADARDAPSAINVVIKPNVNLPKKLHDDWNKYGKDGY